MLTTAFISLVAASLILIGWLANRKLVILQLVPPIRGQNTFWILLLVAASFLGLIGPPWNDTLDMSLIQAGEIEYQKSSPMGQYFNSWNLPAQLFSLPLATGLPPNLVAYGAGTLTAFATLLAAALPLLYLTKSQTGSVAMAVALAFLTTQGAFFDFRPDLLAGSGVYNAQKLFTEHTPGYWGLLLLLIVIGLCLNEMKGVAGFLAGLAVAVHPLYGSIALLIWLFIFTPRTITKYSDFVRQLSPALAGIFVSAVSLAHSATSGSGLRLPRSRSSALETYMKFWDAHRSPQLEVDWRVISVCVLVAFNIWILRRFLRPTQIIPARTWTAVLALCVTSIGAYLVHVQSARLGLGNPVLQFQAGRLPLVPTYLLTPILIGTLALVAKDAFRRSAEERVSRKYVELAGMLALVGFLFAFALNILVGSKPTTLSAGPSCQLNRSGMVLVTSQSEDTTLRLCQNPVLITPSAIDFVPYLPGTAEPVADIITNAYGVSFESVPPQFRHSGGIPDALYRSVWEDRSPAEWRIVAREFGLDGVMVPSDWSLQLTDGQSVLESFTFYSLK